MNKFKVGDIITPNKVKLAHLIDLYGLGENYRVIRLGPSPNSILIVVRHNKNVGWVNPEGWTLVSTPSELERLILTEEDYYE